MTRGPLIERASCHWFSPDLDPRFSALCPSPVLSRRPSQAVLRVALAGLRRARVVVGELDSSHEALHLGCDMRVGGGHRAALVDEEELGPTRSGGDQGEHLLAGPNPVPGEHTEIGRASCRERVWQYV